MIDQPEGLAILDIDEQVPDCVVAFIVIVSVRDGKRRVVAEILPQVSETFLRGLMGRVPREWTDEAPEGIYCIGYDASKFEEGDKLFATLEVSGGADMEFGRALGQATALELIRAGNGLEQLIDALPDEEQIQEHHDNLILKSLAKAGKYGDYRQIVPGFTRAIVTSERGRRQAMEEMQRDPTVFAIASFPIPDESHPFHVFLKELMEDRITRALLGREELVIHSRVKALLHKRRSTVTRWQRDRLDLEINHLTDAFDLEEETVLDHDWHLAQDLDEETGSVELSRDFPSIEA